MWREEKEEKKRIEEKNRVDVNRGAAENRYQPVGQGENGEKSIVIYILDFDGKKGEKEKKKKKKMIVTLPLNTSRVVQLPYI